MLLEEKSFSGELAKYYAAVQPATVWPVVYPKQHLDS
jgi:hypothetical protein